MSPANPTRTIPLEALNRAEKIQAATQRLVDLFKRHGLLHTDPTQALGLELDEIVREFERAEHEAAIEECASKARKCMSGLGAEAAIRALLEGK
jgi:hypothetical protein